VIRWVDCSECQTRLKLECGLGAFEVECPSCGAALDVPATEVGPGVEIGGFAIERLLAVGGMGKLFIARQISMDRLVALKILPAQFCADQENVDRFLHEVRVAARLQHPNVASAYEAGSDEGIYFLAMEYIEGRNLAAIIEEEGPLSEKKALRVGQKLATALAYGWDEHRTVHRDVKPENIVFDRAGEPRLVDMGISKSAVISKKSATEAGTIMGTPNYMSPEQIDDLASADSQSDMFSLGTTL
jgi:serine/threonine-protein kinase